MRGIDGGMAGLENMNVISLVAGLCLGFCLVHRKINGSRIGEDCGTVHLGLT